VSGCSLGLLLVFGLAGVARSHVPHDTVVALAVPPTMDASLPWYLVADPYDTTLLLRSDAAGTDWWHEGGDPVGGDLLGAAMLDDGTPVLLGRDRVWWRDEEGWAWDPLDAEPSAIVADGDGALLLLDGALWRWTPAAGPSLEIEGPAPFLLLGPGPVMVDQDEQVWFPDGEDWDTALAPGVAGAALLADAVYLADYDGAVWRHDGATWQACGALPEPDNGVDPEIHRLAWDGSRLIAAPGWGGPFASSDGCESWEDRRIHGVPGDDLGQARNPGAVWLTLAAHGDRWLLGGYYGLYLSEDAGLRWQEQPLLSPAATRGLAFSPTYWADRTVFWGTYAASVAITQDDGDSFRAPAHGVLEANVQDVRTSAAGNFHVVTVVSGHVPYVSRDGGEHWSRPPGLPGQVIRIFPWNGGREFWALPYELEPPLLESTDGGETFVAPEALIEALEGAQPASAARCQGACAGAVRCLTAVNPTSLLCSTDSGETWEVWYRAAGDEDADHGRDAVTEPALMPLDDPEVVIFGDPSGLHRVTDGGATWVDTELPDGDVPVELGLAAGDHVFAATRSGALFRSDDRGETWIELEPRLSSQATVMVSNPGFTSEAHLLIGNLDGVWELVDPAGEPSLRRWTPYQRVDDNSGFVEAAGCPGQQRDDEAGMDGRQPLPLGCSFTLRMQGETLRVLGVTGDGGAGSLLVDGITVARLPDPNLESRRVLALVEGLEPGWHHLELVGEGDASLAVDAIEATDARGLPYSEPPRFRCGCASGGAVPAGLLGLLGVLGLAARRRR
jgi:MYXO-CTERM domain-containing protein